MAPFDKTTSSAPEGATRNTSIFDAAYRDFSGFVWSLLLRRKDIFPESLKDLHQRVFLALNKVIESEERPRNVKAMLVTITRNEIGTHRRRWKPPVEEGRDPQDFAAREADPEGAAELAERRRKLEVHLKHMDPGAAELIRYVNLYGLTIPEVAGIRKAPVNTVTSQHARAIAKLRELARAAGDDCGV